MTPLATRKVREINESACGRLGAALRDKHAIGKHVSDVGAVPESAYQRQSISMIFESRNDPSKNSPLRISVQPKATAATGSLSPKMGQA
jgi:hypothetical protein